MTAKRVAIISNSLSSTFVFRQSLVGKLAARDQLAFVVSTNDDRGYVAEAERHHPVLLLTGAGLVARVRAFRNVLRKAREECVTVYHGFTHMGNVVAALLWLFNRGTLVLTITGMGRAFSSAGLEYRLFSVLILSFYTLAQFASCRMIVQNEDDRKLLGRILLARNKNLIQKTNGSGIDLRHFDGLNTEARKKDAPLRVGFLSRALSEKGVESYYDLAARHGGDPNLVFLHFGHAGRGSFSEDQIRTTAKQSNVIYCGFVLDPRQPLLELDIVVIPSGYREGLSRLCVESMLAGKLVVARQTAGVRDHLVNGVNAFVYDAPGDLFAAFDAALKSDRAAICANARSYALENFDVEAVDRVYFEAYGDAIDMLQDQTEEHRA